MVAARLATLQDGRPWHREKGVTTPIGAVTTKNIMSIPEAAAALNVGERTVSRQPVRRVELLLRRVRPVRDASEEDERDQRKHESDGGEDDGIHSASVPRLRSAPIGRSREDVAWKSSGATRGLFFGVAVFELY